MSVPLGQDDRSALDRLRAAAKECAGDDLCEIEADRVRLLWLHGSTMIEASVDDDGAAELRAYLVLSLPDPSGAVEQAAALYPLLPLGRLQVDDEGDIQLVHRVAPHSGPSALTVAVAEFAALADRLDDVLRAQTGGELAIERFRQDVLDVVRRGDDGGGLAAKVS